MTFSEKIADLKKMESLLETIDSNTKYKYFFNDVLHNHNSMLNKDKKFIDDYLKYIKPKFNKLFFAVFIILTIVFVVITLKNKTDDPANLNNFISNLFEKSVANGTNEFFAAILPMIISYSIFLWILLCAYHIYKFIEIPLCLIYLAKEKRRTARFLEEKTQILSYDFAVQKIKRLSTVTTKSLLEVTELFNKHNIDVKLRNRENIPLIQKILNDNKEKNPSIEQVCRAIISEGLVKQSFPTDKWCQALLLYDENLNYYNHETNHWINNYKEKRKRILNIIFFIPSLPLRFLAWQFKTIISLIKPSKEDLEREMRRRERSSSYSTGNNSDYIPQTAKNAATQKNYVFRDYNGNLCESGGLFYDSRGYLREWGDAFYDGKDYLCEWGKNFHDSKGNYCSWGSPFYDWENNYIDPR